jgi:hypothetical protein
MLQSSVDHSSEHISFSASKMSSDDTWANFGTLQAMQEEQVAMGYGRALPFQSSSWGLTSG